MNSRVGKKYKIESKHRFTELRSYALQYGDWKAELEELTPLSAVTIDGMPRGSTTGNPTEQTAIKCSTLLSKIRSVEKAARLCSKDESLQAAILFTVTHEYVTFNKLKLQGNLNYERDAFYLARMRFYWELDQILGK